MAVHGQGGVGAWIIRNGNGRYCVFAERCCCSNFPVQLTVKSRRQLTSLDVRLTAPGRRGASVRLIIRNHFISPSQMSAHCT